MTLEGSGRDDTPDPPDQEPCDCCSSWWPTDDITLHAQSGGARCPDCQTCDEECQA